MVYLDIPADMNSTRPTCVIGTIFFFIVSGLVVSNIINIILVYLQYPKKMDFSMYPNDNMKFPSVTFCNLNPDSEKSIDQVLMSASFMGQSVKSSDFQAVDNIVYGKCFSFIATNVTNGVNRTGTSMGLVLKIFIDQSSYISSVEDVGVRIAIHSPDATPYPEDSGISLAPGMSSEIGISEVRREYLAAPYGSCKESIVEDNTETYNSKICEKECLQTAVINQCSCIHPYLPTPEPMPDSVTNSSCLDLTNFESCYQSIESSDFYKSCNCPQDCRVVDYDLNLAYSTWPNANNIDMRNSLINDVINQGGDEFSYLSGLSETEKNTFLSENIVKFTVYFRSMDTSIYEDKPEIEMVDLMGDIGYNIGILVLMLIGLLITCTRKQDNKEL